MKNDFQIKDGVVEIYLTVKGKSVIAIIDEIDFIKVSKFEGTWTGHITDDTGKIYVYMDKKKKGKKKRFYLHRVIMGIEYDKQYVADHRNFNTLDNRRSNLKGMSHGRNSKRKNQDKAKVKKTGSSWSVLVRGEVVGEFETRHEALIHSVHANREHFPELESFTDFDYLLERLEEQRNVEGGELL